MRAGPGGQPARLGLIRASESDLTGHGGDGINFVKIYVIYWW